MDISFDGQLYRPLAIRYPTRVHSGLKLTTTYLFLNTRQPPFTSLKARQALNYAIDRARIIQLLHLDSPDQATPTCQVLPASYPSYQPYCPYTAGPGDGAWHGPDLATAARLAHESGTTHVPVTVWHGSAWANRSAPTSSRYSGSWDTGPLCATYPRTSSTPRSGNPAARSSSASPAGHQTFPPRLTSSSRS